MSIFNMTYNRNSSNPSNSTNTTISMQYDFANVIEIMYLLTYTNATVLRDGPDKNISTGSYFNKTVATVSFMYPYDFYNLIVYINTIICGPLTKTTK